MEKEIEKLKTEYEELQKKIDDLVFVLDLSARGGSALGGQKYKEIAARKSKLEKIISAHEAVNKLKRETRDLKEMRNSDDKDLAQMAEEELPGKEIELKKKESLLEKLMKSGSEEEINPHTKFGVGVNKVIMEIRAGAGGL